MASTVNQRKTIVNSWVRCLENNQLVITSGFPTENFRKRRRSAFIYHTFIYTHNLLQYYKEGDQASVEVEGVEEHINAHLLVKFNAWTSQRLLNRTNLKDSCVS